MGSELVRVEEMSVESLSQKLAEAESPEDLADFKVRVSAYEDYFKAAEADREKYHTAAWLRILTERRLGAEA